MVEKIIDLSDIALILGGSSIVYSSYFLGQYNKTSVLIGGGLAAIGMYQLLMRPVKKHKHFKM